MSKFTEEDVKSLCRLSKLELKEEDVGAFKQDLKRILDYVEKLQEVDVSDISPYSHVEEQGIGSLREDVVGDLLPHKTLIENAPDHVGGMIRVPPIIDA